MESHRLESVRGMNDVLSENYEAYQMIKARLNACFESFGHRPIDVPIVEHTQLYLRKSGEEIVTRMYDFFYQNRRLCLRPEMTASVIRAYVNNLEEKLPLPVRLYYSGPVFRYERPQRSRSRQFTQVGVEAIGAMGPLSDGEMIWTACKCLNELGLTNYRVVIGHIGVLSKFLSNLDLGNRLQNFLLSSMEVIKQEQGQEKVAAKLREIYPLKREDLGSEETENNFDRLSGIFQGMLEEDARRAILELLGNLNIDLTGSRSPEEIADRLLEKIKNQERLPRLDRALEFMTELTHLKGEPFEVLSQGEMLLPKYNINCEPLTELRDILKVLKLYQIDWSKVSLDLGLSRGLQYYTGMIFEIHHGEMEEERQLCGGGRYDDLVATLGGRKGTPATGFSFGLERVHAALEGEKNKLIKPARGMDVFVMSLDSQDYGYAISIAEQLRNRGLKVELDVRDRSVSKNFQYVDKRNFPFAIVVGSEERHSNQVTLRTTDTKESQRLSLEEAANVILNNRLG